MTITRAIFAAVLTAPVILITQAALAATAPPRFGDPIHIANDITLDPMLDARLRHENVELPVLQANAVTIRLRSGFELKDTTYHIAFLAEAEGNLAIDGHYNAFPYLFPNAQSRPQYAVVADPMNIALNRLQLQYRDKNVGLTVGRQRINLDDERWVGSAGWRQNEQTFDAVRGEAKLGPVAVDGTYADRQNTIYGNDGGPRTDYRGRFYFLGGALKTGPVTTKGFAYLIDYDPTAFTVQANSSQTYGARATGTFKLTHDLKLALAGSFARQSAYGSAPVRYAATYAAGEAALAYRRTTVKAGYELLGADATALGGPKALQTPLATLHKFNGWADLFLTTPARGLQDSYGGIAYAFTQVAAVKGLSAQLIYHRFGSDLGSLRYGSELDAAAGFRTGRVNWLVKYADYSAGGFGVDTKKLWLQAEFSL